MTAENASQTAAVPPGTVAIGKGVRAAVRQFSGSQLGWLVVDYIGTAAELIGAGLATEAMLGLRVKGRPRLDLRGRKCTVAAWWVDVATAPVRRHRLSLEGTLEELPGAREAIAAWYAREAARAALYASTVQELSGKPAPEVVAIARRPRPDWLRIVK